MAEGLFRQQAVEQQQDRLWGDVLLLLPISHHVISLTLLAIVVAVGLLLTQGTYSRKETVNGYLVPDTGLFKIYAPRSGSLAELAVKEGEAVSQGAPLFRLASERLLGDGSDLNQHLLDELEQQKHWLQQRIEHQQHAHHLALKQSQTRQQSLRNDLHMLRDQLPLLQQREQMQQERLHSAQLLLAKNHLSRSQVMDRREALLALQSEIQSIERAISQQQDAISQEQISYEQLSVQHADQLAGLNSALSDLNQRIAEARGMGTQVIQAPISGTVTSLQASRGQQVAPGKPLLVMLPDSASLEAELYVPTSAIGFIEPGQPVRLRYAAFPHQRFGTYVGEVTSVDGSILLPQEVDAPFQFAEPVYRITVALSEQAVTAFGKSLSLQPGMLLEADIKLGERSLLEWLLEPLYSLKGRL